MKLNLGCGDHKMDGYINIDLHNREADAWWDLKIIPWFLGRDRQSDGSYGQYEGIDDSSVDEIHANHIIEHLPDTCSVMQEIYRVCKHGAKVQINVPSPRHRDWLGDPTHVAHIIPETMYLFSKKACDDVKARGGANTPLAYYLNVDFDVVSVDYQIDNEYRQYVETQDPGLQHMMRQYWDVVQAYNITLRVVKESQDV